MNFSFRPGMGARGLHLDIKRGWLMKVDSFHNIQLGTVYQYVIINMFFLFDMRFFILI